MTHNYNKAVDFYKEHGGIAIASKWVSGSGRFTKRKNTPYECFEANRSSLEEDLEDKECISKEQKQEIERVLKEHPLEYKFIVMHYSTYKRIRAKEVLKNG